jgi:DNA-binding CsgD family transcriptional regulator
MSFPSFEAEDARLLLDTVSTVYAAPGSQTGWDNLVRTVGELTGSKASVYLLVNSETLTNEVSAVAGFSNADLCAYEGPQGVMKDVRFRRGRNVVLGEVLPLRGDGLSDGELLYGAAVFLIDPKLARAVSMSGVARIFALSRSESAVAVAIAEGLSTGDIADLRGTSVETVRTQVKAVLVKTGASSQLDLLRMAAKLTPPLRDR